MIRHYGLKLGDKVQVHISGVDEICTVFEFNPMDNNKCLLEDSNGKLFEYVCEWCRKIE